jgi:hypothetical protein
MLATEGRTANRRRSRWSLRRSWRPHRLSDLDLTVATYNRDADAGPEFVARDDPRLDGPEAEVGGSARSKSIEAFVAGWLRASPDALLPQLGADRPGAQVLPADAWPDRLPGRSTPDDARDTRVGGRDGLDGKGSVCGGGRRFERGQRNLEHRPCHLPRIDSTKPGPRWNEAAGGGATFITAPNINLYS